ncbi:MAG: phosphoribosylformylglycinamidine cyclo-ligase [Alphaproteobacteria bacterium]|nr:phosphoribosylformylglycinamidine cyclo-ligase [Alphaproteobacteria bacterium]
MTASSRYAAAGVDIDAGNALVERIKPLAAATKRTGSMGSLGGFGGLFDLKALGYQDPILVSCTDGVGTKLKLAQEYNTHGTIGIDLVAMSVNDLVVQGAEPLFFLDYFATGKLSVDIAADVVSGVAEGCKQAGCSLLGGETAEMPGMYAPGEYDLAGFAVGVVERDRILPGTDHMQEGDVLLALASTGVHSNGYSLVRKIVNEQKVSPGQPCSFEPKKSWAEVLLAPTRIYVSACLAATKEPWIKGFSHITGGGLTENLPRVLPDHLAAEVDAKAWEMPKLFSWLAEKGDVSYSEMIRTFNCGIGMVVVVDKASADTAITLLQSKGEQVWRIGQLVARKPETAAFRILNASK